MNWFTLYLLIGMIVTVWRIEYHFTKFMAGVRDERMASVGLVMCAVIIIAFWPIVLFCDAVLED